MGVAIAAWGHFIPEHRVTNAELASRFGITEDWILARTGIEERRYFQGGATSDMIVQAARPCLERARLLPGDLDCLLVATMTPDYHCPSTAAVVQHKLGAHRAVGFDLMAACSGFLYALQVGTALIKAGIHRNVLVCAADQFSCIIDPTDRKTTLIFGDGAGVCLLQHRDDTNSVIDTLSRLDSTCYTDIVQEAGGTQNPFTFKELNAGHHFLRFFSKSISATGVRLMREVIQEIMTKHGLAFSDIDCVVPHQANKRMVEEIAASFNQSISRFLINIEHIGNTSAASIPLAISQALQSGRLRGDETLLLASVGAGYTYAASLIHLNSFAHADH